MTSEEEKITDLSGSPLYMDDDVAEKVGPRLSGPTIRFILNAVRERIKAVETSIADDLDRMRPKDRQAWIDAHKSPL